VPPLISPQGTPGEWFEDPYGELGYTNSGPGIRIPLVIVSPFTRGGHVFTERADHSSILLFLGKSASGISHSGFRSTAFLVQQPEAFADVT
jgi:phospholipase C